MHNTNICLPPVYTDCFPVASEPGHAALSCHLDWSHLQAQLGRQHLYNRVEHMRELQSKVALDTLKIAHLTVPTVLVQGKGRPRSRS